MHAMKLLVTGSNGLIGSYFCRAQQLKKYEVYTVDHTQNSGYGASYSANLAAPADQLTGILEKVKPDIIVHFAAMTNVDQCESLQDKADSINHLSVQRLASYIQHNTSCYLLHMSTDYVFDGRKGNYSEIDPPNPINHYGMTKKLGEDELINCKSDSWCIARTSTPFGLHNKKESFPLYVIKSLQSRKEIRVARDQITSPTYAGNLAQMLHEIIERRIKGTMHVSGKSQISRFDQALQVASFFNLDADLIKGVEIRDLNWQAPRPMNSSLSVKKAEITLMTKPSGFLDSLPMFAKEFSRASQR
jgi:dTDP-4-dehydrorhamnose reductase